MNFYFVGDIHGHHDIKKMNRSNFPEGKSLTDTDYIFMCGDFGLVWSSPEDKIYYKTDKHWIEWLGKQFPLSKILVTLGNHENYDLIEKLPLSEEFGNMVRKLNDQIYILERGRIYTINDVKILSLGGALSWDKEYRIEKQKTLSYKIWWEQELWRESDKQITIAELDSHNWEVDYVVSHIPPTKIKPRLLEIFGGDVYEKSQSDDISDFFDKLIDNNMVFKKWFFGHFHVDFTHGKFHALFDKIKKIEIN